MSYGIRSGGGISELIKQMSYANGNKNRYYWRMIYDLTWFLFIQVTFMNIIFGIIIDTFADLRSKAGERREDMFGNCFICGISKFDIERKTDTTFKMHIRQDHYMWNYLFYIYNLNKKDKTDFNGIESYVYA